MIKNAMIFAAGFGNRMQERTKNIPKPLLKVGGKCLIDIIIDRLLEYGIEKIVINCHYLADQIIHHFKGNQNIIISYEEEILETGGGLLNALPVLNNAHVITVNADTIWYENDLLFQLTHLWESKLCPDLTMTFYDFRKMINHEGEFEILPDNYVVRNKNGRFVYIGVQIINPAILDMSTKKYFSLSEIYNPLICEKAANVYGIEYKGKIFHVGSEEEFKLINGFS